MSKLPELEACMFGGLIARDPDSGVSRKMHDRDGWRDGRSKPFRYKSKTFDVLPDLVDDVTGKVAALGSDRTVNQYNRLRASIEAEDEIAAINQLVKKASASGDLTLMEQAEKARYYSVMRHDENGKIVFEAVDKIEELKIKVI